MLYDNIKWYWTLHKILWNFHPFLCIDAKCTCTYFKNKILILNTLIDAMFHLLQNMLIIFGLKIVGLGVILISNIKLNYFHVWTYLDVLFHMFHSVSVLFVNINHLLISINVRYRINIDKPLKKFIEWIIIMRIPMRLEGYTEKNTLIEASQIQTYFHKLEHNLCKYDSFQKLTKVILQSILKIKKCIGTYILIHSAKKEH